MVLKFSKHDNNNKNKSHTSIEVAEGRNLYPDNVCILRIGVYFSVHKDFKDHLRTILIEDHFDW